MTLLKSVMASSQPLLIAATVAMLTTGCVSQSKYNQLAKQNDELQKRNTVLTVQQRELFAVTVILSKEVELLDEEKAMLETERAELEIELETMLLAGNLKMELLKSGLALTLEEDVLFGSGSTTLKPSGRKAIADLVRELEQVPYQIVVIGHTDNVPIGPVMKKRYPSNWALAAARASAVVSLMAQEGISSNQLVAVSFGDTHPTASNNTPEGRAANRRIEIRLRPVVNTAAAAE
jgi:chemotaxis protein MotB